MRRKRGEESIDEGERQEARKRRKKNVRGVCIEQPVNIARGFTLSSPFPFFSSFRSYSSFSFSSSPRLLLLFFVGLRRAADHSYQHNYKLRSRLSVSLTSLHPSRRNTRSLSRPGETVVFFFFFFFSSAPSSAPLAFLPTVDSFYLAAASSIANSTDP